MLHILNGDTMIPRLASADVPGDRLPWRDLLHLGPVPGGLDLKSLSQVRARFIAEAGWLSLPDAELRFAARDRRLMDAMPGEPLVLWFEHDLYDQLQLIQLLDFLAAQPVRPPVRLVQTDVFLTDLAPGTLASRLPAAPEVTPAQLQLGRRAFGAFRDADPRGFENLLYEDSSPLPHLRSAILRQLEELPGHDSGLSRTEHQILTALAEGHHHPVDLYAANQAQEQACFMGDWPFWLILRGLMTRPKPILRSKTKLPDKNADFLHDAELELTETGYAILENDGDWQALSGRTCWMGGCRTRAAGPDWRWHRGERRVIKLKT